MATRNNTGFSDQVKNQSSYITWSGLLNGDDGDAIEIAGAPDKTVTITGTFGVGGTCSIQGSNNGTTWLVLTDPQGNAITKTADSIEVILESPRFIRPIVTAGDGTTNLTVIICAKYSR